MTFFRIVYIVSGFRIVKPLTFIQDLRILVYLLFSLCIPCYNLPFVLYYSTVTNIFFFNFCTCSLYRIASNSTLSMFLKYQWITSFSLYTHARYFVESAPLYPVLFKNINGERPLCWNACSYETSIKLFFKRSNEKRSSIMLLF